MRSLRPRLRPRHSWTGCCSSSSGGSSSSSSSRSSHTSSSSGSSSDSGVDPTTLIKRQFLLQVHPDFFTQYPRERSINSENLKWLDNYLDGASPFPSPFPSSSSNSASSSFATGSGASPRDLIFYVKTRTSSNSAPPLPASSPPPCSSPVSPSRVVVPLDGRVFHSLHTILSSHCQLGASLPPPLPSPSPSFTSSPRPSSFYNDIDDSSDAFTRARARARAHWGPARQRQEEEEEDARPAPFLDRFLQSVWRRQKHQEQEEGKVGSGGKEGGSSLLRRRQEAAQHMETTTARLRAKWGFESVQLQSDWAAEHLALTLWRLEAALDEYGHSAFQVVHFAGLDVVLSPSLPPSLPQHHPMYHQLQGRRVDAWEGRVSLSPSDPPLHWIETLSQVREEDVREAKAGREEEAALVAAFQTCILPGALLERGRTCARRQYIAWLQQLWEGGRERGREGGERGPREGLLRQWECLRVRVEHDIRSRVLECGVLQANRATLSSPHAVQELVEHLGPEAARARATFKIESEALAELQAWCLHPTALGLRSVQKQVGVSNREMTACLHRLLALPTGNGGGGAREGLRGLDVVVGKTYGVTREGRVMLPWDWVLRNGGGGDHGGV